MTHPERKWIATGAFSAALSVILGAFAAHTLKENFNLPADKLQVFETGVKYQFYHSLALFGLGFCPLPIHHRRIGYLFLAGIILFSGSLYLMSCSSLLGIENLNKLGIITPFGGLSFIAGWLLLGFSALKKQVNNL